MSRGNKFLLLHPTKYLPSTLLPTLLGRICDDPNVPGDNYFPEDPAPFYSKSASPYHIEAHSPSLITDNLTNAATRANFDNVLKMEREKARAHPASWQGELVRIFTLPQVKHVLGNILQSPPLRKQADDWLQGRQELYMITSMMTLVNASCNVKDSGSLNVAMQASLSKAFEAAISAIGGVPVRLPSLAAEWRRRDEQSAQWTAAYVGEVIIAIECRRVARKNGIFSKLLGGGIILRPRSDVPGWSDRTFGGTDGKPKPMSDELHAANSLCIEESGDEAEEWEDQLAKGLDDSERDEVVLVPGLEAANIEGKDGNIMLELRSA